MLRPKACGSLSRKDSSAGAAADSGGGGGAFVFPAGFALLAAGLALGGGVFCIHSGRKEIAARAKYGLECAGTKEQIYFLCILTVLEGRRCDGICWFSP